jgi:hypothetical protein
MKNHEHPNSMTKKSKSRARPRKQTSGIGAIIGGVILAAILFTSVFLYFLVQAQTQSERGKTDVQATRVDEAKRLEAVKVSSFISPITNGTGYDLIPIKIDNTGPLPVNATYAVVSRSDDAVNRQVNSLQLASQNNQTADQVINPGSSAVFLVASKDRTLDNTKTYHIDVISDRGNVIGTQWPPAGPSITVSGAPSLVVQRGYSAQSTVTVTSEDGFSGDASLTVAGLPSGVTATFNANPITVPASGAAASNLLISASATATLGTFPLTITASSGSIQKVTTINLTVVDTGSGSSLPDFWIASNPNPLAVQPGSTSSTQIQVTSLNGFSSAVSLSVSGSYPGITVPSTPNPATVTPPAQGSSPSALSFSIDPTVAPGTYVYTITGTSGTLTRTVQLSVVVLTSGSGERNVGENIGSGTYAVYKGMDPADPTKLQFRTIQAGGGIAITESPADTLLISAAGGSTGEANDGKSLGCDPTYNSQANNPPAVPNCANVYAGKSGTFIQFYSLQAGTGITLTKDIANGNIIIGASSAGEANIGQNIGTGEKIYFGKSGTALQFKSITGSNGVTVTHNLANDTLIIAGGQDVDAILKPQINPVFPNPHGKAGNANPAAQSLWGAIVANPADSPMSIRRVAITGFVPYGSQPTIFPSTGNSPFCPVTNVKPASGGSWTCPAPNTLVWSGTWTIPPHSAQEFFATVGGPTSNNDYPSYAINFNVFTDFGQFAKAGYSGSMRSTPTESASVYLSTTSGSTTPANMLGALSVASGGTTNAIATIANLMDVGQISANTKLIVAIPKEFTNVNVAPNPPSGFGQCTVTIFSDGSSQISCPLTSALNAGQAKSIQFSMTAQPVSTTKLYTMYVLADGTDSNGWPVGPVAENIVRVTP